MGQSTARDPGTNSSAAAKTNPALFGWYWGTYRVEGGEGEGDERRKKIEKGERRGKERTREQKRRGERWIMNRCRAFLSLFLFLVGT